MWCVCPYIRPWPVGLCISASITYKFIGILTMTITKPYKFIGILTMTTTKPYKFIGVLTIESPPCPGRRQLAVQTGAEAARDPGFR